MCMHEQGSHKILLLCIASTLVGKCIFLHKALPTEKEHLVLKVTTNHDRLFPFWHLQLHLRLIALIDVKKNRRRDR